MSKTTVTGIIGIGLAIVWGLATIFSVDIPAFPEDIAGVVGLIVASIGNLKSRDDDNVDKGN